MYVMINKTSGICPVDGHIGAAGSKHGVSLDLNMSLGVMSSRVMVNGFL